MSELSPETKTLLSLARAGVPVAPGHRARIKAAVMANIAVAALSASTATAASTGVAGVLKFIGAFAVGASLGVGALVVHHQVTNSAPNAAPTVSASIPASGAHPSDRAPAPSSLQSAGSASAALPQSPPPAETRSARGSLAVDTTETPSESAELPSMRTTSVSPLPAAPLPSAPSPQFALQEEARLLREADRAMKARDWTGALRILDEHAARFPSGTLAPERAVQRVLALCGAGRVDQARREAAPMLTGTSGPLEDRLRSSCVGSP